MNFRWFLLTLAIGCGDDDSGRPDAASAPDAARDAASPLDASGKDSATPSDAATDAATNAATDAATSAELRYRNGSRLKRIALRTEGSVDLLLAWYDSKLDTECAIARTSEGDDVERCMPLLGRGMGIGDVFLDENCAGAVVSLTPASACLDQALPKFGSDSDNGPCGTVSKVFPLSPPPADFATRQLFTRNPGSGKPCAPASVADTARAHPSSGDVLIRGADLPLSMFVKVVGQERSDGTPSVLGSVTEDGALQLWGYSGADGKRCTPTHIGDLDLCVPKLASFSKWFSDPSCSTPLIEDRGANSVCPHADTSSVKVAVDRGPICAPTTPRFYSVGMGVNPTRYTRDATCAVDSSPLYTSLFERGAEIPSSSFTPTRSRVEGSGRLRVRSFLDDRGRRVAVETATMWDEQLQQSCTPYRPIGEKMYCVPDFATEVFTDAACTQQALATPCSGLKPGNLVLGPKIDLSARGCFVNVVMKLGAQLQAATSYVKLGDQCAPNPTPPAAIYANAGVVPASALAEMPHLVTP